MKKELKNKILFVINPKAGTRRKQDTDSVISQYSGKEKFEYKIYRTSGKDDLEQIRRHLKEYQPSAVIAVGGDGTVNMVAGELVGSKIALGIIPAGSANGLAYNLNIPDKFEDALEKNLEDTAKPMDVIKINDRHFCLHLGDVGLNARVVKRFEKDGSKGWIGYGKQLFKELMEGKTWISFYIEIPGLRRKKMKANMIVVANANSYGTGAIINPTGKINDGKFEIVVIRPYPWWFLFTFIFTSFTGYLHKKKYVKVYSASEAKITLVKPQEFQIDGEMFPETKYLKVEILPGALKVIGA